MLANVLRPVILPFYQLFGADPAMFAGSILANDMGGAPLAMELAGTRAAGQLGGLIVGSMLGATVVFSIPVALGILQPEDRPALARGVLAGLLAQTCENLLEQGITPDVYYNGHLAYERDDVKEHNDALVDKYYRRMRNL